jgi:hypothetical protein
MATEAEGIKAIIALQAMAGITETEDQARAGWASMSEHERTTTMEVHQLLGRAPSPARCKDKTKAKAG